MSVRVELLLARFYKIDPLTGISKNLDTLKAVSQWRMVMNTGTVKFFNESKGFGFITPDNGSDDLFVHISAVECGVLNDNQKVSFEIGEGRRGPCAVRVKPV